MKISVMIINRNAKKIELDVPEGKSATVLSVKKILQEKEGTLPEDQTIIFQSQTFADDKKLEDYNVEDGASLQAMFKSSLTPSNSSDNSLSPIVPKHESNNNNNHTEEAKKPQDPSQIVDLEFDPVQDRPRKMSASEEAFFFGASN